MASCVLTAVVNQPGTVRVDFADGSSTEFASLADLREWCLSADNQDNARKICVAYAMARSSDLSNIAPVRNKTFTFDLTQNQPIKIA